MAKTAGRTSKIEEEGHDDDGDDAYTPAQFKAAGFSAAGMTTDEQGNRMSLLPGSSRPSKTRPASNGKEDKTIASFSSSAA